MPACEMKCFSRRPCGRSKPDRRFPRPGLRVEDVVKAPAVVADFRKVIRQDPRIIQKLHRRVFVDKLTRDQVRGAGRKRHAASDVRMQGRQCPLQILCIPV